MNNLLIISGFSGAGKGTVVKELLRSSSNITLVTSDTTRPKRNNLDNYNYVTKSEFLARKSSGFYLESNEYGGEFYGTPIGAVKAAFSDKKTVLLEIDYNGMKQIIHHTELSDAEITTVFIAVNAKALVQHLVDRGEPAQSIAKRLEIALSENAELNEYDYVLVNDKVDNTVAEILNIVNQKLPSGDCFDCERFAQEISAILREMSMESKEHG